MGKDYSDLRGAQKMLEAEETQKYNKELAEKLEIMGFERDPEFDTSEKECYMQGSTIAFLPKFKKASRPYTGYLNRRYIAYMEQNSK
jgi:hypothetical protein